MYQFKEIIDNEADFREIMGEPSDLVIAAKSQTFLDTHCQAFIKRSPFLLIATADKQGRFDVSPKGDPAGFVEILDEHTLAIPDRLGNRKADTFSNILQNPSVGLIFLVPGKRETVRVSGKACIVRDAELRKRLAVNGKEPELIFGVHVEEAFFHCAKCVMRSKLWKPDAWPSLEGLPTLAEAMVDAGKLDQSYDEMQEIIENDEKERFY